MTGFGHGCKSRCSVISVESHNCYGLVSLFSCSFWSPLVSWRLFSVAPSFGPVFAILQLLASCVFQVFQKNADFESEVVAQSSIVSVYVNSDRLREAAEVAEETCPGGFFPQQHKLMGSSAQISSGVCRCGSQEQVPEEPSKVPEGSGGFGCVLV